MAIETRPSRRPVTEEGRGLPRAILALTCVLGLVAIAVWHSARPAAPPVAAGLVPAPTGDVLGTSTGPAMVIPPGRLQVRVPILEYHYIRVNPDPSDHLGFNLSVTPDDFRAQMDWLAANHYHPVTIADLRAYFQSGTPLPSRPVVLTFDDGYADFYTTAFPILAEHNFRAVAYIVPGFLNRRMYMTPDQVVALDRTGMVEIASHTMTHVNLVAAAPADLAWQVGQSKAVLEGMLGHPVLDFCYPAGAFNQAVVNALVAAGYRTATTELWGTSHSSSDAMTWTRVRVGGGEKLPEFSAGLGIPEPVVAASSGVGRSG
jgi:peptidoglycan/xylan/chitin deacetylase (PgdA/CDA1 family)